MPQTWFQLVKRSKKKRNKILLSQLIEDLHDSIIGNNTNAITVENETVEPQTGSLVNNFGKSAVSENSTSHDQIIEGNIADRMKKEVSNGVTAVENRPWRNFDGNGSNTES